MRLHRPQLPADRVVVWARVGQIVALTMVIAATVMTCAPDSASPVAPTVLDGLASPPGLTPQDDGRLLIAEVGGGRILVLDRQNQLSVLHEDLPWLKNGPEGAPAGVSAAVQMGGATYYVVGEARAKGFREVYEITPGAHPVGLTGQDPLGIHPPKPIVNPYDLLVASSGGLLVSDAGANVVLAR